MINHASNSPSRIPSLGVLLVAALLPLGACLADDAPRITLTAKTTAHPAAFEVLGVPAAELARLKTLEPDDPAFGKLFAIYVAGNTDDSSVPPVGGTYRVDGARLVFTPRFPAVAGLKYRAVLTVSNGTPLERELALPKAPTRDVKAARVEQIYPSADVLPENHLRFYIHFSEPMDRGQAYEHLELLDQAGKPVEAAFLELGEELWDPSGRRFTLLLDPGRIKQGLKPREELGPILRAGQKYTLVVKKGWRDQSGQSVAADSRKAFSVGPVVDEAIDTKQWKLNAPFLDTKQPLVVRFPRPLDRALLERTFSVVGDSGKRVAGRVTIGDDERRWEFTPDSPWKGEPLHLIVDGVLEDTAGNSITRPFEVDEQRPIDKTVKTETVKFPISLSEGY